MGTSTPNTTGEHQHDFVTGTALVFLKRDKYLSRNINNVLQNNQLSEAVRDEQITKMIEDKMRKTREKMSLAAIVNSMPKVMEYLNKKEAEKLEKKGQENQTGSTT